MTYSVVILTFNEALNIADCIASVQSDDVVVLDSLSTDDTQAIARQAGARVCERAFDDYAQQRNAALDLAGYKHDWVFMLDADERMTPALHAEIVRVLADVAVTTGLFRVRRQDLFLDHWLRRSSGYPTWFGRLIRRGAVRVERGINEEFHTDLAIGELSEHIVHHPFNKGVDYWFERHNRYSSMEAQVLAVERVAPLRAADLIASDPIVRRRALKQLAYRLPARPTLVFLYLYLIRGGFRDGRGGYLYCRMRACYETMIDLKASVFAAGGR